jgi:hypothetical protein
LHLAIQDENSCVKPSIKNMSLFSSMLQDGYKLRLQVTGTSMLPFLKTGSYVTLFRAPLPELKIGDIIYCCGDDEECKLHRLISTKNDRLITKGDALGFPDQPFQKKHYLGKVILIEQEHANATVSRNMELRSAQRANYLIAVFHRVKLHLIFSFIGFAVNLFNDIIKFLKLVPARHCSRP